jgi:inosine/xanthosine triphosphatase
MEKGKKTCKEKKSMKIAIGSLNPTKVQAVEKVFKDDTVLSISVPSDVSNQPLTDDETMKGAINRAYHSRTESKADMGIGLEGGVIISGDKLLLCNWGALAYNGGVLVASGAKILLPSEFIPALQDGRELAELMEGYTKKKDIRSKEGAIGIFTNGRITRQQMFEHVCELLLGQLEYLKKSNC